MKRDIDLQRKILFVIEDKYNPGDGTLYNLTVQGYDLKTIAEHCDLLNQQGLITYYKASYADDTIYSFQVGNLSSEGYDFLELVRNDEIWEKTKTEVKQKNLPATIKEITEVAGLFIGKVVKAIVT